MRAFGQALSWVGLAGTTVFVFAGTFAVLARVWADSFTRTLEVLVAAPFVGLWVLSPLLWVVRPVGEDAPGGDERLALLGAVLVVAAGACSYLWAFLVQPALFDVEPGAESLMLVLVVPGVQWGILGAVGALRWLGSRNDATRRRP